MSRVDNIVKVASVSKTFYDFWRRPKVKAVQDLSLEIKPGEIYGLLGPNGAGKSTTIKMLLGLLFPSKGQISILGKPPRTKQTKHQIGYMPEESYLYKFLTAEETLRFYGKTFGFSKSMMDKRIDQLLHLVGLKGVEGRLVGEFSKGMARRVVFAQSLINDPKFLILDEPTSGMDPIGHREFKSLILHLKEKGKTLLICSHLLSEMQDLCDRVGVMHRGKMIAQGSMNELLQKSETLEDYFIQNVTQAEQKELTGTNEKNFHGLFENEDTSSKDESNSEEKTDETITENGQKSEEDLVDQNYLDKLTKGE